ncbi:hypothetical protein [Herbaspirillum autotrophicum]|uniref:hypothetical protein n=1 Tax=Herbaspirillum autotrophicum TaxID=180195 RepID=UPI00067D58A6|nr:hypothetical protein [Herbaspirillum autotrophicum]
MDASTRGKFFLTQQLLPGLINGAIAWAIHAGDSVIGLWDRGAYANDLLATGFLLPAITWFILRPLLPAAVPFRWPDWRGPGWTAGCRRRCGAAP